MKPNNFFEELKKREMLQDFSNGLFELTEEKLKGYCGFDITANSLQVGNLAVIMLLKRFQQFGHQPYALLGGATSLIGDPSFKKDERILIDKEEIIRRKEKISKQLQKLLRSENGPEVKILDNIDWLGKMNLIDFLRDVGKFITVNYMQAKDSVKTRMATGISYAEFTYQLFQGYDFCYLYENHGVTLQMGGADQWGNLTTGIELARKKLGAHLQAFSTPLITKSNGEKFGKSESGRGLWLDSEMTSPYEFYQFWMNVSDAEASRYLRVFTLKSLEEIENLEKDHKDNPGSRILQKSLAEDVTSFVHSKEEFQRARNNSEVLFSKEKSLREIESQDFESLFFDIPQFDIPKEALQMEITDIVINYSKGEIFSSKGDLSRTIKEGGFYINKEKFDTNNQKKLGNLLIHNKYIVIQKGKKNYFLLKFA